MPSDMKPLLEKLEAKEQLTFSDFEAVLTVYREAMADNRISFREALRIGLAVLKILGEFVEKTPAGAGTNFGF